MLYLTDDLGAALRKCTPQGKVVPPLQRLEIGLRSASALLSASSDAASTSGLSRAN